MVTALAPEKYYRTRIESFTQRRSNRDGYSKTVTVEFTIEGVTYAGTGEALDRHLRRYQRRINSALDGRWPMSVVTNSHGTPARICIDVEFWIQFVVVHVVE